MALVQGCPPLFNTAQGVQCTSRAWTGGWEQAGVDDEHGWPRPGAGQHRCRTPMAQRQV